MSDNEQTLSDAGESSAPAEVNNFVTDGDLISTVETSAQPIGDQTSEAAEQNTVGADKADEVDSNGKDMPESTEAKQADDIDRFDKLPRFQELISSVNELKNQNAELKGRLEGLSQTNKTADMEAKAPVDLGYEDITEMDNDDLLDKFNEDPKGFLANWGRQVAHEVKAEITSQVQNDMESRTYEEKIAKTFTSYGEQNPDFKTMWDSGEIEKFMNENPGHNAISAHQLMTSQARMDAAIAKAIKETEAKTIKSIQAKQKAGTLSAGPASTGRTIEGVAPELKDPKKFGGMMTVLAQRHAARRAAGR